MKTKIKTILFLILMLFIIGLSSEVQAASANISTTKTSAIVGDSVTITVSINAATWNLKVSGNGISGDSIVGFNSDGNNQSSSKTFALNTSSTGVYTIYLTGDVTDGETDVNSSINKSVTVQVNPKPVTPTNPSNGNSSSGGSTGNSGSSNNGSTNNKPTTKPVETPKSTDSTLKSLIVEGYELYPEFNANTKEYNIKVGNDITSVNIVPTVNDSKASYKLEGAYEELVVGENTVNVVVTAEDGSTNRYIIKITREREALKLITLNISYKDSEGNLKILNLNPELSDEIFEYKLEDLSYLISKLDVEVVANLEEAKIEITGNEKLSEGENTITIVITMPAESEELEDEVLTYKITVNKEEEPVVTPIGKFKNWFKGITGTVSTWLGENQYKIIVGSLMLCSACMGGISVYLVIEYKKYRMLLQKIAEITRLNNANANIPQTINNVNLEDNKIENIQEKNNVEIQEDNIVKTKGKHF